MSKQEWNYTENTTALADTGDYETIVQFTNGLDCLETGGDEMEEEELKTFCDLLNKMPDLWSHKLDATEFENSQLRKQVDYLKSALEKISNGTQPYNEREAFSFVETSRAISDEALKMNDVFQGFA